MKVVVRSSSLLFTLLSIIFHAPIRRAKRLESVSEEPRTELGSPAVPHRDAGRAVETGRQSDLFF
ncbi:MAG TPA: hypothetical protein VKX49_28555 [Bryobacteraceae bacterium]|nr:hypothetical protein [Bryobacteraceae bacterium]